MSFEYEKFGEDELRAVLNFCINGVPDGKIISMDGKVQKKEVVANIILFLSYITGENFYNTEPWKHIKNIDGFIILIKNEVQKWEKQKDQV